MDEFTYNLIKPRASMDNETRATLERIRDEINLTATTQPNPAIRNRLNEVSDLLFEILEQTKPHVK